MVFTKLERKTKVILSIQMVGMLMGASTHILWVITYGFLSSEYNANLFTSLFWDSLTFFDPIAAFLLIVRPKVGVYLTLGIILVDVVHNNIFYMDELYFQTYSLMEWMVKYWMIVGQVVFGVFVTLTFKSNLLDIRKKRALK